MCMRVCVCVRMYVHACVCVCVCVYLPMDGDLKGYLSGRSTRTFHTPPSYGAEEHVHCMAGQNTVHVHCTRVIIHNFLCAEQM